MLPLPVLLQSWLAGLTSFLHAGNAALCHPAVTAFQFHGIVPGLLLGTLWLLSGLIRLRELKRQRRRAFAKLHHGAGRGSYTKLAEQEVGGRAGREWLQQGRLQAAASCRFVGGAACRLHTVYDTEPGTRNPLPPGGCTATAGRVGGAAGAGLPEPLPLQLALRARPALR